MKVNIKDYIIFDLETTGLSTSNDQIIELSALKVINNQVVDEFSTLVNPNIPIPRLASEVNGITNKMVKDAPFIKEVLPKFINFIENYPLVGHNIKSFDLKFIYRDCNDYLNIIPNNDCIDTLYISRKYLLELGHYRLVDLANYYAISIKGAHRALNDCIMNQLVFEHLKEEMTKETTVKTCPKCGSILAKRKGPYGTFWGCTGYPNCHYTQKN